MPTKETGWSHPVVSNRHVQNILFTYLMLPAQSNIIQYSTQSPAQQDKSHTSINACRRSWLYQRSGDCTRRPSCAPFVLHSKIICNKIKYLYLILSDILYFIKRVYKKSYRPYRHNISLKSRLISTRHSVKAGPARKYLILLRISHGMGQPGASEVSSLKSVSFAF